MSYRRLGAGPAVLFIHGWPLHGATYRKMAEALSDRYSCYVIDLPGAGSTPSYDDWTDPLAAYTQTVLEVIDGLGLERLAIVGHDSGGAVARRVAAELGDRIVALVLSNTEITGYVVKVVERYARLVRVPGVRALMRALFRSRAFRRSGYGFGGCFADRDLIEGEFFELFIRPLLADKERFAAAMDVLAHVDFDDLADLAPYHARIRAPTRFVWGARDPFFPIEGARRMASELPAFDRLVEIPDGKLLVHEEYPELLSSVTAELLAAVTPRHRAA